MQLASKDAHEARQLATALAQAVWVSSSDQPSPGTEIQAAKAETAARALLFLATHASAAEGAELPLFMDHTTQQLSAGPSDTSSPPLDSLKRLLWIFRQKNEAQLRAAQSAAEKSKRPETEDGKSAIQRGMAFALWSARNPADQNLQKLVRMLTQSGP
eukprot:CAMPEP_0175134854 /NCGR_PEP_ID=MMETSP0087-20121206/8401_1 /TAXON_ID=136419 /ORGANISM="Unknown Unknown, Strain D1" /LENGTH=157 /DNA_ID=CAMNT_0016417445 /DNA_START=72 /DNA_END=545 /DNA_ORIENTATION=+